jgi:hypothetical protein
MKKFKVIARNGINNRDRIVFGLTSRTLAEETAVVFATAPDMFRDIKIEPYIDYEEEEDDND